VGVEKQLHQFPASENRGRLGSGLGYGRVVTSPTAALAVVTLIAGHVLAAHNTNGWKWSWAELHFMPIS